jgi:hypothetical protein
MSIARRTETPSLFTLTGEFVQILNMLEQSPDDETLEQQLMQVAQELVQKVERCAWTIKDLERLAEQRSAESAESRDQAQKIKKVVSKLKLSMIDSMRATGHDDRPLLAGRYTLNIRKNPESVIVSDVTLVPAEFIKPRKLTEDDVSKTAVKDLWKKTGVIAPGCDIARGERLEIK